MQGGRGILLLALCSLLAWRVACSDSLRFIVMGDWGGSEQPPYTTPLQLNVARQLAKTAEQWDPSFLLALGDNFYYHGISTSASDARFKNTFEDVYTAASLQIPWYILAGNHDHKGNVSAEVAYSGMSNRWRFPSLWYTFAVPFGGSSVQFVVMDTVVFAGTWDSTPQPEGPKNRALRDAQYDWLVQTLASSTADWLFVMGHYPVWSVSNHGPTDVLVQYLKPLLEQYKVAAYMCGHDHNLQHLNDNTTVDYYLSGAANFQDPSMPHKAAVPPGSLKFFWPPPSNPDDEGGFITMELQGKCTLRVDYYNSNGDHLYAHQKTNPRARC